MSAQHTPGPGFDNAAWREKHSMRRGHPSAYCRECRGAGASLARHCVGRTLTDSEEVAIAAGALDFIDGQWVGIHPTRAAIAKVTGSAA